MPIIIAIINEVFQSTFAPLFSIKRFHSKVTMIVTARVMANVINMLVIRDFVFIFKIVFMSKNFGSVCFTIEHNRPSNKVSK